MYIDTPGVADIDEKRRTQAGIEIEKALKYNANYKIVFVITLESWRIKPGDLTTIDLICDAIKTNFNYGVIVNRVSEEFIKQEEAKNLLRQQIEKLLHKKPSSVIFLKNVSSMENADNVYFQANDENRKSLLNFLDKLQATKIIENQVGKIDTRDDITKSNEMEKKCNKMKKECDEMKKKSDEMEKEFNETEKESNETEKKCHETENKYDKQL